MLEALELQKLAREVFAKQLPEVALTDLTTEPFVGGDGDEKVRVTLLFDPQAFEAITGESALTLLLAMNDAMQVAGEQRFASIEYATTDDVPVDED